MRRLLLFSVVVSSDGIEPVRTIRWNLSLHPVLATIQYFNLKNRLLDSLVLKNVIVKEAVVSKFWTERTCS